MAGYRAFFNRDQRVQSRPPWKLRSSYLLMPSSSIAILNRVPPIAWDQHSLLFLMAFPSAQSISNLTSPRCRLCTSGILRVRNPLESEFSPGTKTDPGGLPVDRYRMNGKIFEGTFFPHLLDDVMAGRIESDFRPRTRKQVNLVATRCALIGQPSCRESIIRRPRLLLARLPK